MSSRGIVRVLAIASVMALSGCGAAASASDGQYLSKVGDCTADHFGENCTVYSFDDGFAKCYVALGRSKGDEPPVAMQCFRLAP